MLIPHIKRMLDKTYNGVLNTRQDQIKIQSPLPLLPHHLNLNPDVLVP